MNQRPYFFLLCSILAYASAGIAPTSCVAQVSYDFVRSESGTVLARLELSTIPVDFTGIQSLTFTPAGEDFFGFGPEYTGTFDQGFSEFIDDGIGGLGRPINASAVAAEDISGVPSSSKYTTAPDASFSIRIGTEEGTDILVFAFNQGAGLVPAAFVDFRLVPEPTTGILCALATLFGISNHRRLKRKTGH